jgi:hypothetical protein
MTVLQRVALQLDDQHVNLLDQLLDVLQLGSRQAAGASATGKCNAHCTLLRCDGRIQRCPHLPRLPSRPPGTCGRGRGPSRARSKPPGPLADGGQAPVGGPVGQGRPGRGGGQGAPGRGWGVRAERGPGRGWGQGGLGAVSQQPVRLQWANAMIKRRMA